MSLGYTIAYRSELNFKRKALDFGSEEYIIGGIKLLPIEILLSPTSFFPFINFAY